MPEPLSPDNKSTSPKTADDINDLFKEIDNDETKESKQPKKEAKVEDKESPDEKEDIAEVEDEDLELKDPEEEIEKLDLNEKDDENIEAPPRKKEILKAYPDLFKKFPFLEKMMYRDKEMTELFGSFDNAKEVAERSEIFSNFETQLLAGNTEEILKEVKLADEKAFNIIVDDYLPTLAKVDKEAYFHVVGNLNKRLIMEMVEEANNLGDNDLKEAALIVQRFIFGTSKFTAPTTRVEKKPENNEAEAERLSVLKERFESARDDLQNRVDNTLKATISEYIDPKGAMSSYVKKNAVADAMKILSSDIAKDPATVKNLDRLWKEAFGSKFSQESLKKIQSFYLSKAKGNLKNAILKARGEALKDLAPKREKEDEVEEETRTPRQRNITPGRPSQPKGRNQMQKGETVTDFFMRD